MTKTMKLLAIAAMLGSVLSACNKEEGGKSLTSSKATITINIDGVKNSWNKGDKFTIFTGDGTAISATLTKSGTSAAFKPASSPGDGKLVAVWPENAATFSSGVLSTTIPTEQKYDEEAFVLVGSGTKKALSFTTPFAALCVKVKGTCVVGSIDVSASSPIAGSVSVDTGAENPSAASATAKSITMKEINATVAGEGTFTLAIAPGTYESLKVTMRDADNNPKMVEIKNVTVAAGASCEAEITHTAPINLSASGLANCYVVPSAGEYKFAAKKLDGTAVVGEAADYVWTSVEYEYETKHVEFNTGSGDNVTTVSGDAIEVKGMKGTPDAEWVVKDIFYDKTSGSVSFTATGNKGNALIAIYNTVGENVEVVWSWHIWSTGRTLEQMTVKDWQTKHLVEMDKKESWLDVNLGAFETENGNNVEVYGLLYQWGRKEPFPGARILGSQATAGLDTGKLPFGDATMPLLVNTKFGLGFATSAELPTMADAAKYPLNYYNASNYWCSDSDNVNWGDGFNRWAFGNIGPFLTNTDEAWNYTDGPRKADYEKNINDPCPPGFRVPTIEQILLSFGMWVADASKIDGVAYNFTEHWGDNFTSERPFLSYTRRIISYADENKTMLYPCSGYRQAGGWIDQVGKSNYYPSATRKKDTNTYYRMIVGTNLRMDTSAGSYSIARNIRCVKAD